MYLSLLVLCACQHDTNSRQPAGQPLKIDTGNAQKTYDVLKYQDVKLVDSLYEGLFDALTAKDQFPLLFRHLNYYKKIRNDVPKAQGLIELAKGSLYSRQGDMDSGNYHLQQAIDIYQKLDMKQAMAQAYGGMASNAIFKADYAVALSYQYKALHIYEQLNDTNKIYSVKMHMAGVHEKQHDYSKAMSLAAESRNYYSYKRDTAGTASAEYYLASIYYQLKNYDSGMHYALSSLELNRQSGNTKETARSLNMIAVISTALKSWGTAEASFRQCISLVDDRRQLAYLNYNLAVVLQHLGKVDSAAAMFGLLVKDGNTDPLLASRCYDAMVDIATDKKDYASTLLFHKKYKAAIDSVYSSDKARSISELNIKYETDKKKEQIARLEVVHKADGFKKLAYLSGLILVSIISGLVILFLRSRHRTHELMIQKVQQELSGNKRELQRFTDSILSKNELISELELKLADKPLAAAATFTDEEDLSTLYQFKILTDEHWKEFKLLFDKVHPGLITRLRNLYPELAPAEERQFLLIRLNLTNKECADMLGISQESVTKNRYRLKKRFSLIETDNLDLFVKSI